MANDITTDITWEILIWAEQSGQGVAVTKLNDGATLELQQLPKGETHYIVNNRYYIQVYARVLIRFRKEPEDVAT